MAVLKVVVVTQRSWNAEATKQKANSRAKTATVGEHSECAVEARCQRSTAGRRSSADPNQDGRSVRVRQELRI